MNKLRQQGLAYSTIKKAYDALNACLKFAVANHIIPYNPMQTVVTPSKKHFKIKKIEILNDIEIETLYKEAANKISRYDYVIILMLYTGVRSSEVLALKWNDYNAKDKILTIDGALVWVKNRDNNENGIKYKLLEQDTAKTKKSIRKIYLGTKAMTALNEFYNQNYRGNDDDYIICTENYTPLFARNLQRAFDGILNRSNITHKGLHALRHSFASMLIRKGVDIKVVSELLGHSDVSFTYNQYIHIIDEQKNMAIQKLNEI